MSNGAVHELLKMPVLVTFVAAESDCLQMSHYSSLKQQDELKTSQLAQ